MPTIEPQIWKSARLTIERSKSEKQDTVFRFSGPLTTRDMYSSLSPAEFRNIFEPIPGDEPPHVQIFDLNGVPYMDSTGLGMLASHYTRCQRQRHSIEHYRPGPSRSGIVQAHRNVACASDRFDVELCWKLWQQSSPRLKSLVFGKLLRRAERPRG